MILSKIKDTVKNILKDIFDIKRLFYSLNIKEKIELGKILLFGLLINSIYGVFHGQFSDLFFLIFIIYGIIKLIKAERSIT